jgi:hypothetical protein
MQATKYLDPNLKQSRTVEVSVLEITFSLHRRLVHDSGVVGGAARGFYTLTLMFINLINLIFLVWDFP